MNQFKLTVSFMCLALALISTAASAQSMHEKSTRVVKYSLDVVNSRGILEGFIERNQQQSDSTKQKMKSIVSQVNFDYLAARLADGYQKQVTESDVGRCIGFIDSPLGQKFIAAVKTSEFMRDPETFFSVARYQRAAGHRELHVRKLRPVEPVKQKGINGCV